MARASSDSNVTGVDLRGLFDRACSEVLRLGNNVIENCLVRVWRVFMSLIPE